MWFDLVYKLPAPANFLFVTPLSGTCCFSGTCQYDSHQQSIAGVINWVYIGNIYSSRITFDTKVRKRYLSKLGRWQCPISKAASNQVASLHLEWCFVTTVQLTRPGPLRWSYSILSGDNHDQVSKWLELLPNFWYSQLFIKSRSVCNT